LSSISRVAFSAASPAPITSSRLRRTTRSSRRRALWCRAMRIEARLPLMNRMVNTASMMNTNQGGADDPLQVAEAGIAPHAVIEAEQVEDRQLDCEDDEQDGDVVVGALGEMQGVEAEVAGEEIGGYEQGDVGCQDQPEVEAEAAAPQPAEVLVELG